MEALALLPKLTSPSTLPRELLRLFSLLEELGGFRATRLERWRLPINSAAGLRHHGLRGPRGVVEGGCGEVEVEVGEHLEEIRTVTVQRILAMRRVGRIFAVRHQE